MKVDFKWMKPEKQIMRETTKENNGILFLANEAKRLMDPYVPADNLVLAQNTEIYVEDDKGIVEYTTPHAHYQWEGELYVSSKTGSPWASEGEYKIPATPAKDLEHSKFRHPLATSHWDTAMKISRGDDLARAMEEFIKK